MWFVLCDTEPYTLTAVNFQLNFVAIIHHYPSRKDITKPFYIMYLFED